MWHLALPVRHDSPQYIERSADRRAATLIASGQSVLVYGPRKIGKTSLLLKIRDQQEIQGRKSIYIDLQGCSGGDVLKYIYMQVARQIGRRVTSKQLINHDLVPLFHHASKRSTDSWVILLLDEVDVVRSHQSELRRLDALRHLVSSLAKVVCVCATYSPPWSWEGADQGEASPWANTFAEIPLRVFDIDEVRLLMAKVGIINDSIMRKVCNVTGGRPEFLAHLAGDIADG
jgi:AAA-like domain